jgi:cell wall-associated NlpC family hydrolase
MLAICHLSIVPVRKESSHRSEQVTQLLFGDLVEITDSSDNWQHVRILDDNYSGWIDSRQVQPLKDEVALLVNSSPTLLAADVVGTLQSALRPLTQIVLGSKLPLSSLQTGPMLWGALHYNGSTVHPHRPDQKQIEHFARLYLGAPYLWGGKSPFGIDCSGFTQMVYKLNGVSLPRDAWQQALVGHEVTEHEKMVMGDLAFFSNTEGKVVHVGILLDENNIIHASGQVRIDRLEKRQIIHAESGQASHHLCCVKRLF